LGIGTFICVDYEALWRSVGKEDLNVFKHERRSTIFKNPQNFADAASVKTISYWGRVTVILQKSQNQNHHGLQ